MKTTKLIILTAILGMATLLTGCNLLDRGYDTVAIQHPAITNSVTVMETNSIVNPANGQLEQTITPHVTVKIQPAYTTTELMDKPLIASGIQTLKSLPIPYASIGASFLAAAVSIYKLIRNKQALKAVVVGVEAGREMLQNTPQGQILDAKIKDILIKHQEEAGVLHIVSDVVNSYTGDTVKAPTT